MKTVFLRALEAENKAATLRTAIVAPEAAMGRVRFEVDVRTFATVPRAPFAYWVGERLRNLFVECEPFEGHGRAARVGVQTSDDARFVRAWWAVSPKGESTRWVPFLKGGGASAFYSDIRLTLNWEQNGQELKAFAESTPGTTHWSRAIRSTDWYFQPGFSWASRTSRFAPSCVPQGCIFSVSRYQAFAPVDTLLGLVGLLNGSTCNELLRMCCDWYSRPKFIIGIVQTLPYPVDPAGRLVALSSLARRAWSLTRSLDMCSETSHAFLLPALLRVEGITLAARASAWTERVGEHQAALSTIQREIDEHCFELYGIDESDRSAITKGFIGDPVGSETSREAAESNSDENDDDVDADADADAGPDATDAATLAADLVSWAVGVAFGRFDVRLANGELAMPSEPGPFDPLPVCSPGMLTGDDGLPLGSPPPAYPVSYPDNGILVDDPGHARDLTAAVRTVFEVVFGSRADAIWQEAATHLDAQDHDLRRWLASGFFEHHLRHHSRSRRKAPILWQLGIPSGRYSIWAYAHRMTRDSLLAIQNDLIAPKLAHEERRLSSLVAQAGHSPSVRARGDVAAQEGLVDELRTLAAEVRRTAPLWTPDLDDGIVLAIAPLWRLVPQHKAWQKELHAKWVELAAGKYDWAHLAMHLWPERVVAKCADDRSLAIAHRQEDVFWIEGPDGKWTPRSSPTRSIDDLVAARSSPAVKAALAELIAAPVPVASAGRR
jgi:hypothetical protein